MNEEGVRAEIQQRKEAFRREQRALPFVEKVCIAFELSRRRNTLEQARPVQLEGDLLPSSEGQEP